MIARHCPMRNSSKSSPKTLVSYLTDSKDVPERVLAINITHCLAYLDKNPDEYDSDDLELAIREMHVVQSMNTTARSEKMYHLLISFRDEPNKETIKKIEEEFCEALGFKEHQRVSVLHGDTDNLHLHIAINKIHPRTFNIHNPFHDQITLAKTAERLEKKYGIQLDNHEFKTNARPSAAIAMEKAGDMESLIGWMQRNCTEALKNAASWDEFHKALASVNISIKVQNNGFIFTSGKVHVKASSVDRSLSKRKLESRLGTFVSIQKNIPVRKQYIMKPMNHGFRNDYIYEQFQRERREASRFRAMELRELFLKEKEEIREVFDSSVSDQITKMIRNKFWRKILRLLKKQENLSKVKAIQAKYDKAEKQIKAKYERLSWRAWLDREVKNGNISALHVIQARGEVQPTSNYLQIDQSTESKNVVKVTRKGSRLFSDGTREYKGCWQFRKFSDPVSLQKTKQHLRNWFIRNSDKELRVSGNTSFIDTVLDVVKELRIKPHFEQQELAQRIAPQTRDREQGKSVYRGR